MKLIIATCLLVSSISAFAQPPRAALDACHNAAAESPCRFNSPHGSVEGTCLQPPRERQLVCVPDHMRRGPSETAARNQRPPTRTHTTIQSKGNIGAIKADRKPISPNKITTNIVNGERILAANGIAAHLTGLFPNRGNPHSIRAQNYLFKVPAKPVLAGKTTTLGMHNFGLAVNGVPFDPGAAEWYLGNRRSGWQYEAMSGAIPLGLDENHAHVQPQGAYHYHGLPTLLTSHLKVSPTVHSPLVGWAADGFPIYALYGYSVTDDPNSNIIEKTSSYRLKRGKRPAGSDDPGGYYDGTFVADYEYVENTGDLDECNGQQTQTPEFPTGTYAYFLTKSFPIIPRCFKGTPSNTFTQQRAR